MKFCIKMRTTFSFLIVLFLVSTFNITIGFAQDSSVYMYWTDHFAGKIQRANLDGTNVQDIVTGLGWSTDIAFDMSMNKMYWTNRDTTSKIQRANLDGTKIETLVTSDTSLKESIALDISGGKMYWTKENKIQRANLDGTKIETLVTDIISLRGIALEFSQGKMYWADYGSSKIQRANLDGTKIEDVVTGLNRPNRIALDFSGGKIYWADESAGKIQCANFDGSHIRDLVLGLDFPIGIALDTSNGKMYWTDPGANKIQRANLDGTNIEDLVTIAGEPSGIALSIPQTPGGLRFSPNVIADQTFTVNTSVNLNLPNAVGGTAPYTYTLTPNLPAGLQFDPLDRWIGGTPIAVMPQSTYTYTATDATGASASLTFTITVTAGADNLDVNGDGQVNVLDLILVAVFYGTRGDGLPADVNADGVVNVQDFAAVAAGVEAALLAVAAQAGDIKAIAGAPTSFGNLAQHAWSKKVAYHNVAAALADVKRLAANDVRLGKGVALLSELLHLLKEMNAIPGTTALLPNYPNPFNPETWIPYHLATDAEVTLTIYDVRGNVVRELMLGHQSAGVYESRHRAAYWDGRNHLGEAVASGLYFYTLTAGDFSATRKMLILK